ncbi:PPC domain-containing protein [Sanguibacter sp. HDW7]|uniref:PPC domain-containing protein n=1 Tax=Sanguibacter sp. HDW7 TaxID=2714931 RepID=UPI00140B6C60|nr:PPC domain-containing protein [Sanguibacter sp. HDW7]QIK83612.1 hypothetical protein G7063_08200 [Sanguibacter sp. HDW7]
MTMPGSDPYSTPTPGPGAPPPPTAAPTYGVPAGQPYGAPAGQPYGAPAAQPYPTSGGYAPAPGGYGQPQYGAPAWQPAPRMRKTLGAKILTFTGLGLSIVAVVMLVVGIGRIAETAPASLTELADSIASADTPGSTQVALTAGSTYEIWTSRSTSAFLDVDDILVTTPSGGTVAVVGATGDVSVNDLNASIVGRVTAPESGTYTIDVTSDMGVLTFMPNGTFDDLLTGFMAGTGLILGSLAVGGLGFCLLLAGAIWWGVAASNNRRVRALGGGGTPMSGAVVHPGL